jgi:hypothetical protein
MFPAYLDCQFLITSSSCVPYVASFSRLSVLYYPFVLCTLFCQFLWIVSFDYPFVLLPVSLNCLFLITPSSCVSYVASFPGLSVLDYPFVLCTLCCQFLWIVHFWLPLRLVFPMLPVSLDCPFFISSSSCVGVIKNGQSRETGNIGYTRRRGNQKWTIQRNWQHRVHKTKG